MMQDFLGGGKHTVAENCSGVKTPIPKVACSVEWPLLNPNWDLQKKNKKLFFSRKSTILTFKQCSIIFPKADRVDIGLQLDGHLHLPLYAVQSHEWTSCWKEKHHS